ncbi:ribbon-helix-helix protein [Vibrio phage 1.131.O._10N.222.49.A8]|nr:ribbon-helix-helix protein [Vibrio phage 1.131.O._10N.222.49.A8]
MAQYRTTIPDEINDLLKSAAKRERRSKDQFIMTILERVADKERKQQEKEGVKNE